MGNYLLIHWGGVYLTEGVVLLCGYHYRMICGGFIELGWNLLPRSRKFESGYRGNRPGVHKAFMAFAEAFMAFAEALRGIPFSDIKGFFEDRFLDPFDRTAYEIRNLLLEKYQKTWPDMVK